VDRTRPPSDDDDAELYHGTLVVAITTGTPFLLECFVARAIGTSTYERIANQFVDHRMTVVWRGEPGQNGDPSVLSPQQLSG
jgi:hypothetical protein